MVVKNGGLWWNPLKNPLKQIQEPVSTIRAFAIERHFKKTVAEFCSTQMFGAKKKQLNPLTHDVLRGSGYLGYVDSNQGYNSYK